MAKCAMHTELKMMSPRFVGPALGSVWVGDRDNKCHSVVE